MELCRYGSGAFFVSGILFLILRLTGKAETATFIYSCGVVSVLALAASFCHARFRLPAREQLTVYLSSLVPGGGIILSAAECGKESGALPPLPPLPRIRFVKLPLFLSALLAGGFFAAGALYIPLKRAVPSPVSHELDLKDESGRLNAALESLRRSSPEGAQKALSLQKELEETVKNADPAAPGRSYELLHELNKLLQHELAAESAKNSRLLSQTRALQESLKTLERSGKTGDHARAFSDLLKALAQKDKDLAEILKKGGFDGSQLNAEQLKELARTLGSESERLKRSLQDMRTCLENTSQNSSADRRAAKEELEQFIKENVPGCDDLIEALTNRAANGTEESAMEGGAARGGGSGNAARGRGDAVLEFSGYTPEYGAERVDHKIPSQEPGNRKDSTRLGRFVSESEQKEETYTVQGGNLRTNTGYAGFQESNLHPAHRRAVRRYFEKRK